MTKMEEAKKFYQEIRGKQSDDIKKEWFDEFEMQVYFEGKDDKMWCRKGSNDGLVTIFLDKKYVWIKKNYMMPVKREERKQKQFS